MEAKLSKSVISKKNWKELVPHREDILLQDFLAFPKNIVLLERERGLSYIKILSRIGEEKGSVKFNDPLYTAYFAANPEYNSPNLYFGYSSMRTPDSVYSYSLKAGRKKLLKQPLFA